MTWNYRVVQRRYTGSLGEEEITYAIHEVFYDAIPDLKSRPPRNHAIATTSEPTTVVADDVEGLRWVLTQMLEALDKPSIDYDTQQELLRDADPPVESRPR